MEPKAGAPGRMRAGTRAKRGGAEADDSRSHLSFEAGSRRWLQKERR
jgi:hypothetical protein